MQVPVQIDTPMHTVLGILHLPMVRARGGPAIVMNYGLNGDRVDNHRLGVLFAQRAASAGIPVLRFDYGGCGVSGGEFYDTSISTKTADAMAMIDFVQGCMGDDPAKLVLLGYSDAIRIVANVLAVRSDIAGAVFWNPIVRAMTRTFRPGERRRGTIEPRTKKLVFPLFGTYMGLDYLKEANSDLDIEGVLDRRLSKLFVFGTGDTHTEQFQRELKEIGLRRSDFDLREVGGANHLFNRTEWAEAVVRETLDWIALQWGTASAEVRTVGP